MHWISSPIMNTLANFQSEHFYHVFNRTNNKEPLFRSDENRNYFLTQYIKYLNNFVDTYSYSILPNHFHFSISIKSISDLMTNIQKIDPKLRSRDQDIFIAADEKESLCHSLISSQFARFFTSYSQAFNKMHERSGNLLNRPFKRSLIKLDTRFGLLQHYIHHNAQKHGIVKSFEQYQWSSYAIIISNEETFLNRDFVLNWFGGKESFIRFHRNQQEGSDFEDITG